MKAYLLQSEVARELRIPRSQVDRAIPPIIVAGRKRYAREVLEQLTKHQQSKPPQVATTYPTLSQCAAMAKQSGIIK